MDVVRGCKYGRSLRLFWRLYRASLFPPLPSGWALVDDEYDEMIADRICVGKKVLYILDRGWDERESHATWLRWFSAFGILEHIDFRQIHFRELLTASGLVMIQAQAFDGLLSLILRFRC